MHPKKRDFFILFFLLSPVNHYQQKKKKKKKKMGRKRPRKTPTETKQENQELANALNTVRELISTEGFIAKLTEFAGEERQVGKDIVEKALRQSIKNETEATQLKDEYITQIMNRAKKAKRVPKQNATDEATQTTLPDTAFVSELIWVIKHHGVIQSTDERRKARGCTENRPTDTLGAKHFFEYYKQQNIMPEQEYDAFMKTLSTPLPMVMRFTDTRSYSSEILNQLQTRPELSKNLTPIKWLESSTMAVKMLHSQYHSKDPELQKASEWCKNQHSLGTSSFQEEVSLIPVHLLRPEPSDLVLDMCSAPGSKLMHCADIMTKKSIENKTPITGGIVSNEIEKKKARQVLPGRLKRGHASHIIVLQSDARLLPSFIDREMNRIRFDKIICDVPCTGDGTARKAEALETWSAHYGLGLHHKQLQILLKGIDSLAVGGTLVYSTCSLNPIENESVVAAALASKPNEIKVEFIPQEAIPTLRAQPGLTTWQVPDESGKLFSVCPEDKESLQNSNWRPTMFPQTETSINEQLPNCLRMLPHHNDTGGFFVAVIKRIKLAEPKESDPVPILPRKAQQSNSKAEDQPAANSTNTYKLGGMRNAKLYYELGSNVDEIWQQVQSYYDFCSNDPTELGLNLPILVQMDDQDRSKKKNLYTCTPGVLKILRSYIPNTQSNFVVVSAVGCRMLTLIKGKYLAGQTKCNYRPAFEGCRSLALISSDSKKITLSSAELIRLLDDKSIPTSSLSVLPEPLYVGPCLVGLHNQLSNSMWSEVWLSCILLNHKLELNVEDHERVGLLKLLKDVFEK